MGTLGTLGKIVILPFKLIFGGKKKELPPTEVPLVYPPSAPSQPTYPTSPSGYTAPDTATENLRAKVDLMLTQIDSLKIEYEAINQRIQNIERMVRELYTMAKS